MRMWFIFCSEKNVLKLIFCSEFKTMRTAGILPPKVEIQFQEMLMNF